MRPSRPLLGVILVLLVLAQGCARQVAPADRTGAPVAAATSPDAFPLTIADDDGVSVTLDAPPQRIVTFAPSATEILFALGLGGRIVGVSGSYDDYPAAAKKIEQVGGAGDFGVDPNIEKVVSLRPDLLVTIEGGDQWKKRLRALGVPVFTINSTSFDDTLHDIQTVGRLTGTTGPANQLVAGMRADAQAIQAKVADEPAVSCFYEVYYPPLMTVGPNTFIADLLRMAGCDSVSAAAKTDYPQWSVDDLVRANPDVYLVSSESASSPAAVATRPGFDAIAAVTNGRVVPIDADLVSRPGPRIVDGLRVLSQALHPDLFG